MQVSVCDDAQLYNIYLPPLFENHSEGMALKYTPSSPFPSFERWLTREIAPRTSLIPESMASPLGLMPAQMPARKHSCIFNLHHAIRLHMQAGSIREKNPPPHSNLGGNRLTPAAPRNIQAQVAVLE